MEEEIIVAPTEEVVEETGDLNEPEIDEEGENLEEEVDEDEEFNPDNLFDDEDLADPDEYKLGGYDLSKFKDTFDWENKEDLQELEVQMNKYADKGFTQEQIEFLIEEEINEEGPRKPTSKELKEKLKSSLTVEEKRNYKFVNNYLGNVLKGTEFEGRVNDIMMNPSLVKLFHQVYKSTQGKTTRLDKVSKAKEAPIRTLSYEEASNTLMKTITSKGDKQSVAKDLYSKVSDKESFKQLLNTVGINIK